MNTLVEALRRVGADIAALGRPWAVVGGLAVTARALPRTTRDVDVAVAVSDDAAAESVVFALRGAGYAVAAVVEQTATHRLATARLRAPGTSVVPVDLLFASSGIEAEIAADAETIEIVPGLSLPVARTGHLLAMKLLARDDRWRPQDADDLRALLAVADATERRRCVDGLRLIEDRGFARDRDLLAAWARLEAGED